MNRNLLKSGAALVLAAALFSCGKERLEPSSLNASQPAPGMEQNAPEAGLLMPQLQPRLSTIQYDGQPFLTFTRDLSGRITKVDGGEHITTYTYGNGQVQIDRFRPFSNDSLFRYTAVLNSKGAITSMSGRIYGETGEVYEAKYTFFYNSYGRLTGMSKVYALWGETTYVTYTYGWTGSDLTSCTMSSNGKFLGKKGYQYANALPDKRGVWNDILDIYTDRLFGTRSIHLCTAESSTDPVTMKTVAHKIAWTLSAAGYPKQQTVYSYQGNPIYSFDYVFQKSW